MNFSIAFIIFCCKIYLLAQPAALLGVRNESIFLLNFYELYAPYHPYQMGLSSISTSSPWQTRMLSSLFIILNNRNNKFTFYAISSCLMSLHGTMFVQINLN